MARLYVNGQLIADVDVGEFRFTPRARPASQLFALQPYRCPGCGGFVTQDQRCLNSIPNAEVVRWISE
jgi:hypothetical protein